ncbi:MAG: twin-arginine translocase TatA/TatE family subunit [Flavobacteriales bacterium]|nr:twin-arginine translocase TatA/TatE family subunit [Flavobacteriales bacterium]
MNHTVLLFFNLGGGELFVILLFIIIFFGAKKIPELARGLGKGIREFKNATSDIQKEIRNNASNPLDDIDITKDLKD